MRAFISAVGTILVAAPTLAAGQATPTTQSATTPSPAAITVVGCVAKSPDGKGFLLTRQADAPGTAPGTSATGEAPSGSVTADTPTGATATETAVPTPPVGEPGTQVNPASPTFNQGGTGTSGTVGRPDTSAAIASASYQLKTTQGVDLAPHVGHTVEVRGTLGRDPRASDVPDRAASPSSVNAPVLTVQSLQHRAASCTR